MFLFLNRHSSNPHLKDIHSSFSLANMIRIINMLIIFRLLRIVPNIKVRDGLWVCGWGMELFSHLSAVQEFFWWLRACART